MNPPDGLRTEFAGEARDFRRSSGGQGMLIVIALLAVYLILGILYESLVHPITIISTLPSAGLGALLALMLFGSELTLIAFIGIILLIGIVKKNGIMLVDFAISAERARGLTARAVGARGGGRALPPDPDDDARRAVRRAAAGDRHRRRRRNCAARSASPSSAASCCRRS